MKIIVRHLFSLIALGALGFQSQGLADTVITFKEGVTELPQTLVENLQGLNYSVKNAWPDKDRFVIQSLPRDTWDKVLRTSRLAIRIHGQNMVSVADVPGIESVEDNLDLPRNPGLLSSVDAFDPPACPGIIYGFFQNAKTTQRLENASSCDNFAIAPSGAFRYTITLRASSPKRVQVFEHGDKIADQAMTTGQFDTSFHYGYRQRYITVSGEPGEYTLEISPNTDKVGPQIPFVLSDYFSNGYGFGIPAGAKLLGRASLQSEWIGARMMDAGSFWASGYKGEGIKVAIVDTGVAYQHPFLKNSVVGGFSAFNNGTSPSDYDDVHGHGSHVAGIVHQVAPNAQILAVRVFDADDAGTTPDIIAKGVRWAVDNGADVINLSLGGNTAPAGWRDVFNYAVSKGAIMAVSSGNGRALIPMWPAAFAADIPGFGFSVGALNDLTELAAFSNWAGENPNMKQVSAHGVDVLSVDYSSNGFIAYSGTSMSSPQIAGFLALMKQAYPSASNEEIISMLSRNVKRAQIND